MIDARELLRRRWVRGGILAAFAAGLWMVAVDWSWFMEDCPDCGLHRDVVQYRVFAVPIQERFIDEEYLLQKVARDLGVPCLHPRMSASRFHKHRWWGLIYCAAPCWNGTWYLASESDWYGPNESARVFALAKEEPALPAEFSRRLLQDVQYWDLPGDREFFRSVLDRADVRSPDAGLAAEAVTSP
ncbi:hypothetical protein [Alienimonas chondri]|uniref:Uncharacterized protein n=1 Tax=Alienimonas chondri TaxID=2681879 RepID=A0ABX1VHY9_9PLAN|nr:hypothetical protein [Alienimonas chondri]NNJ27685.1 hypothetical protein [Alienimonas chondri]